MLKQSHFLRSIFVCVDPFKEAAEAERNGGEKRAQKSKVIKQHQNIILLEPPKILILLTEKQTFHTTMLLETKGRSKQELSSTKDKTMTQTRQLTQI